MYKKKKKCGIKILLNVSSNCNFNRRNQFKISASNEFYLNRSNNY